MSSNGNVAEEKSCDKCEEIFRNERELRFHKTVKHITDKDAIIGTKRDESFMTKSESQSPRNKKRNIEPTEHIKTALTKNNPTEREYTIKFNEPSVETKNIISKEQISVNKDNAQSDVTNTNTKSAEFERKKIRKGT